MSNNVNTDLLERASEVAEELISHPTGVDKRIRKLIEENDLENLRIAVAYGESILAEEVMEGYDVY